MSNVDVPPDPFFPNIIFNPSFFVAATSSGGGGISTSYANAHYLQSFTGDNAISDANSTKFNNNVGIGTAATVSNKLIVYGSCKIVNGGIDLATDVVTNSPIYLSLNGGSCIGCANAAAQFSTSAIAGDTVLRGKTGNKLLLLSGSGTAAASIIDNGTVGIGTTNPNTNCKLTVEGKATIGTGSATYASVFNDANTGLIIANSAPANPTPQQLVISDTANNNSALLLGNNYNAGSSFGSIQTIVAGIGYKALALNPVDGNVGIGTTNPQTKLDVRGKLNLGIIGGVTGIPSLGTYGGDGDRIILYPGTASIYPYSIGISGGIQWYNSPDGAVHQFYVGGARILYLGSYAHFDKNITIAPQTANDNQLYLVAPPFANNYCSIKFQNSSSQQTFIGLGGAAVGGVFQGNTFIQSPAAIALTVNNTASTGKAAMFIDAGANVGINTNSCAYRFSVHAPSGNVVLGVTDAGDMGVNNIIATGQLSCATYSSFPSYNNIISKQIGRNPNATGVGGYWLINVQEYLNNMSYNSILFTMYFAPSSMYWTGRIFLYGSTAVNNVDQSANGPVIDGTLFYSAPNYYLKISMSNGYNLTGSSTLYYKTVG